MQVWGRGRGLPVAVALLVSAAVCACGEPTSSSTPQGGRNGSEGGRAATPGGSGGVGGSLGCAGTTSGANVFVAEISGTGSCLPRSLPVTDRRVSCAAVEVLPAPCNCAVQEGERAATPAVDLAVRSQLKAVGAAFGCEDVCVCSLTQLEGSSLSGCQDNVQASAPPGFCYIDPAQGVGSAELVSDCPTSSQRALRFLGARTPENGNTWMIGCGEGL